jgi:hypothetical protein
MNRERNLLHLVGALHASRRFTRGLNRREEEPNKNTDDGDNNEKFDKGKTSPFPTRKVRNSHTEPRRI